MINADKPQRWKDDVMASVQLYNTWFLDAAPKAYRDTRANVVSDVESAMRATDDMRSITADVLQRHPEILATLRMSTAPPIARDRLIGLSGVRQSLVKSLEDGRLPARMNRLELRRDLDAICSTLTDLLDLDLFDWLGTNGPTPEQRQLAAVVVGDRRCGALADPIVRNAQEQRQLALIEDWLTGRNYNKRTHPSHLPLKQMPPGTFSFRQNVVVGGLNGAPQYNMPIDVVIQPMQPRHDRMPILLEAKSAGDFTNTNKRRKEEATKIHQLRATYGDDTKLFLFLCGYFDSGYLGYEAAEGLDWIWEHRVDDLAHTGA